MQSEGVAADIATRCGFVQRVAQTVVYCSRVLLDVEAMYCWSVIDGQPVDGIGRMRARVPLVDEFDVGASSEKGVVRVFVEDCSADEASNQVSRKSDDQSVQQKKGPSYLPLPIRVAIQLVVMRHEFLLCSVWRMVV